MATEILSEQAFESVADDTLHRLEGELSELDGMEVSLEMGILTLEFPDGDKYVVNSHRAARQIWMAAERSAWHFDYHPDARRWIAPKNGDELVETLAAVTSRKLGQAISLQAMR